MADSMSVINYDCACQRVQVSIKGIPITQAYCHCASCQKYDQQSPRRLALFKKDDVRVVKGEEFVKDFSKPGSNPIRRFCTVNSLRLTTFRQSLFYALVAGHYDEVLRDEYNEFCPPQ